MSLFLGSVSVDSVRTRKMLTVGNKRRFDGSIGRVLAAPASCVATTNLRLAVEGLELCAEWVLADP